jgi:hypothetical protein
MVATVDFALPGFRRALEPFRRNPADAREEVLQKGSVTKR